MCNRSTDLVLPTSATPAGSARVATRHDTDPAPAVPYRPVPHLRLPLHKGRHLGHVHQDDRQRHDPRGGAHPAAQHQHLQRLPLNVLAVPHGELLRVCG